MITIDEETAAEYGLNVAIFCSKIAGWVKWNKANNQNFHDGRYWSYNTLIALTRLFPFWTVDQLRKVIKDAISCGLIVKGNYNQTKYDQTLWYTLTDLGCEVWRIPSWENPQMGSGNSPNQDGENPTPIPIHNHSLKPITNRASNYSNKKRSRGSVNLTSYPEDFFPDDERRQLLTDHARRTNNNESYLLERFEAVSLKYKTKSDNWQLKFQEFLESEKPKRTYEDKTGKQRRYDSQSLNY